MQNMRWLSGFVKYARYCTKPREWYDLVVIGGGSGGLACAKEAASLGKVVAVVDHVTPSPRNSTWALGGTCVNVGCIPKKLFHQAALLGDSLQHAQDYGWQFGQDIHHDWHVLRAAVSNYIKSLNWGYRVQLKRMSVDYFNAKGSFINRHAIKIKFKSDEDVLNANYAVIAVGGRPMYPRDVKNIQEYAISSDDIFSLPNPPGKTLIIGASYVALECASFLTDLGFDTSVMVRSICLRGFDQQMAGIVTAHMSSRGTHFLNKCIPLGVEKLENGHLKVTWQDNSGKTYSDVFETVMVAIGREAQTRSLGLEKIGVVVNPSTLKVSAQNEQSTVSNIFAIGDVLHGKPELTPVAIKAGKLLARRLFGNSLVQMDYENVATTVFTSLEYACVGLSEEDAIEKYGEDSVEVFHAYYQPLEFSLSHKNCEHCYVKAVCLKTITQLVLGLHLIGPNAGEIIQGFAVAMKRGMNMEQLNETVGIHPTVAEEVVKLNITKRSGVDPKVTGC